MYYVVIDVFCILVLRSYFPGKEGNSHALALNRCKRMQIGKQCGTCIRHIGLKSIMEYFSIYTVRHYNPLLI
jgi:hypothetical protein